MNYIFGAIFLATIGIFGITESLNENKITLFDFSNTSNISKWRIVNDDVMGGISTSSFERDKNGIGVFQGRVSTENYGGFASVRYSMKKTKVEKATTVRIRLKGDGKNYQFRMKHKSSDYFSYINTFSTSGDWQVVEMKLSDFFPSFRGRKLNKPNFDKDSIEQIAILIANKKNEKFRLEIDKIELY